MTIMMNTAKTGYTITITYNELHIIADALQELTTRIESGETDYTAVYEGINTDLTDAGTYHTVLESADYNINGAIGASTEASTITITITA